MVITKEVKILPWNKDILDDMEIMWQQKWKNNIKLTAHQPKTTISHINYNKIYRILKQGKKAQKASKIKAEM